MVAFSIIILIMLPIVAVIILTNAGIDVVSDHLVGVNTQTQKIEIKDPLNGKVIAEVSPLMEWPVAGVVTLEFGESDWPYQPFHTGIDIANPKVRSATRLFPLWQEQLLMPEKYSGDMESIFRLIMGITFHLFTHI